MYPRRSPAPFRSPIKAVHTLTVRTSDDSLKRNINSIYICESAKREDWCSVGAVARWVVLPGRWYFTVYCVVENENSPLRSNTFEDLTMYLNTGNGDHLLCPNCSGISRRRWQCLPAIKCSAVYAILSRVVITGRTQGHTSGWVSIGRLKWRGDDSGVPRRYRSGKGFKKDAPRVTRLSW